MRLGWIALSGVLFACGTGPGGGAAGGPLGEDPGGTGIGDEDPGSTGVGDEDPGGSGGPGQGGSGNTGNVGGDGGTGETGGGGTGGGGGDCLSICAECGGGALCPDICANATTEQLTCAQAAPDCAGKQACFGLGTGGTGGGTGGVGTGGSSGGCTAPSDCGGCPAGTCEQCLCVTNNDTATCAPLCG